MLYCQFLIDSVEKRKVHVLLLQKEKIDKEKKIYIEFIPSFSSLLRAAEIQIQSKADVLNILCWYSLNDAALLGIDVAKGIPVVT